MIAISNSDSFQRAGERRKGEEVRAGAAELAAVFVPAPALWARADSGNGE
jgi:hypothetical protein